MSADYDGIIIGAGHNALVLQGYLGLAGLKTLCLERLSVPGGGLSTVEDVRRPGFFHNTHSYFHRAITDMPWYTDLGLERRGARYVEPELNTALVLKDGRVLQWWTDFTRTVNSFAEFSRRDAATLRRWRDDFQPVVEKILGPEQRRPPLEPETRHRWLASSPEGRLLQQVSRQSPLEFVLGQFENPVIQAGLLFFNGLREVDLRCRGMGYHIPMLLASAKKAQACIGGAGALALALARAAAETGGEIRCRTTPRRVIIENGKAAGVELARGEMVRAGFVVSGLDPQQSFIDLLAGSPLPEQWRKRAANFQYNLIAPLFALNLNLAEAPGYRAAGNCPGLERALMVILGLEHFEQYPEIVACHERGEIPATVMWGSCPTVFDPDQAPPGFHTAFMWEKLPYAAGGDPSNWDRIKDGHGRRLLDLWSQYAPNLAGKAVLSWFTRSPLDVERQFPNMRRGDLLVGAFTNGQIGFDRPFPGAGNYRGYFEGYYLCGACCHPGGNITGLPGYNCAQVLLADLGIKAPWTPAALAG